MSCYSYHMVPRLLKIAAIIAATALAGCAVTSQNLTQDTGNQNRAGQESGCQLPIFTHHVTDPATIESILPPLFRNSRGVMPTALLDISGRAPVYLPAAGTLVEASYHLEEGTAFYWLGFDAGCGVFVVLDHLTEVTPDIAAALPDTPRPEGDSRTAPVASPLPLSAGTLVGHTTGSVRAGNWNFSVFNESARNSLWDGETQPGRNPGYTAVCPFAYFSEDLRQQYGALFQLKHSGSTHTEDNLCDDL